MIDSSHSPRLVLRTQSRQDNVAKDVLRQQGRPAGRMVEGAPA
ncbi:MAG: hypothetical protein ACLGI6_05660 [Gammaproteobacteria bacterium]